MAKFTDVTIGWDGQGVTCEPEIAQVYYAHPSGPDSVRWTVEAFPDGANRVEIRWDTQAPFRDLGAGQHNGKVQLVATGNRGIQGLFKYTILFLADGQIVAGLDPHVKDDPEPPQPPVPPG